MIVFQIKNRNFITTKDFTHCCQKSGDMTIRTTRKSALKKELGKYKKRAKQTFPQGARWLPFPDNNPKF